SLDEGGFMRATYGVRSFGRIASPLFLALVRETLLATALIGFCSPSLLAQKSTGPARGVVIAGGGEPAVRRFVELAGGRTAKIVVFVTGPSALRFGDQNTILNPDWPRDRVEWSQYKDYLKGWFGVDSLQFVHTRNRTEANTEAFVAPLK